MQRVNTAAGSARGIDVSNRRRYIVVQVDEHVRAVVDASRRTEIFCQVISRRQHQIRLPDDALGGVGSCWFAWHTGWGTWKHSPVSGPGVVASIRDRACLGDQ